MGSRANSNASPLLRLHPAALQRIGGGSATGFQKKMLPGLNNINNGTQTMITLLYMKPDIFLMGPKKLDHGKQMLAYLLQVSSYL